MTNEIVKSEPASSQLNWTKLQTILSACILVLLLAVSIFLVAQFSAVGSCARAIERELEVLDTDTINHSIESLNDAAQQLDEIDLDALASSLEDAAENFQSVDVAQLNSLVRALESVATKLENAVNLLSNPFQRR